MAQLKSTVVQGNLVVTDNSSASCFIKLDGTSDQILMADGNVKVIDSELSSTSINPVQNKVINTALGEKLTANGWSASATALTSPIDEYACEVSLRTQGIKYTEKGASYFISYPIKSGVFALITDIPTIDTALSSTSTNPVQNSVITTALGNKLDANNWSTENNKLSYSLNYEEIKIGVNGIYVNSDITQTTANLTWPTQSGKIAIIDDIQSYIDTAILGGSW